MNLFVYWSLVSEREHPRSLAWQGQALSPLSSEPYLSAPLPLGRWITCVLIAPQHLLTDTKQTRLASLFRFLGLSSSLCSQGISLPISSDLGHPGWSYLPASKIDGERSTIIVETRNRLEFAWNGIPVLSVIRVSACVERWVWGRGCISKFSFKAKTLRKQTQKPAVRLSDKKELRIRMQRAWLNFAFIYEA